MADKARIEHPAEGRYRLCGELSFATISSLLAQGNAMFEGRGQVILDLEKVERADSAGLALLVEWLRLARRRNVPLVIRNITPQLRAMAKVTGLDQVLPLNNN